MNTQLKFTEKADEKYLNNSIKYLTDTYPFIKSEVIGHSVLGREIQSLKFGVGHEKILFCGAFHGMEWITSLILLNFIEKLCVSKIEHTCIADIDIRTTMATRQLVIIPTINPDGVEICLHGEGSAKGLSEHIRQISQGDTTHWQANARGVDINHNFNAGWDILHKMEMESGIHGPAKTQFGGYSPESEPETRLLTSLCRENVFRHAYAFHSQGEEIYWNYGERTPKRSRLMARIMSAASGYKAAKPTGLASHGGFKDWFIDEFHRPAFTIEVGLGKNPLPITDLQSIYEKIEEMMMLCVIM